MVALLLTPAVPILFRARCHSGVRRRLGQHGDGQAAVPDRDRRGSWSAGPPAAPRGHDRRPSPGWWGPVACWARTWSAPSRATAAPGSPRCRFPGPSPDAAVSHLHGAATDFLEAADGGPWQVAWCAGAGVTATSLCSPRARSSPTSTPCWTGCARRVRGTFFLASSAGALLRRLAGPLRSTRPRPSPRSPSTGGSRPGWRSAVARWAADTGGRAVARAHRQPVRAGAGAGEAPRTDLAASSGRS